MPPLPRIRTPALADLAAQLRFAPPETLRRQMARAEELAAEVTTDGAYPEDWIAFRITGYRPDLNTPAVLAGSALLSDLSAFIERLSAGAPSPRSDTHLDAEALAARWSVSRKTIDRCRRRGLIAHRSFTSGGRPCLAFPLAAVERFESAHHDGLARAAAFSRIPPEVERRMIRRAAVYRRRLRCSLNQAAERLAGRYGRSLEAVRQLLRRSDTSGVPVFGEKGPPGARERRLIDRAARLGIEPAAIARYLGRSTPGVRRVITDERAARLRSLAADATPSPATADSDTEALLGDPAVSNGLGAPGVTDLLAFVEAARAGAAPDPHLERARAAAYHLLLARASAISRALPAHGARAALVDEAETLLRWAARLKAELVRSQLPVLVRSVEATTRRLDEVRSAVLADLLRAALAAAAEAVDAYQPGPRTGRLAAPTGLLVTRAATRFARDHPEEFPAAAGGRRGASRSAAPRASPRLRPGIPFDDWSLRLSPWQAAIEPAARVRRALPFLQEATRRLLVLRYGWDGPPLSIARLAGALGTTVMRAAILERRAVREARSAAR